MEEIGSNNQQNTTETAQNGGMTQEQMLAEIQAAEQFDLEGESDEEYDEELTPQETAIYEAIDPSNMKTYLAQAIQYQFAKDYDNACMVLKLILMKIGGILGNPLHLQLATIYYMMGKNHFSGLLFVCSLTPSMLFIRIC